MNIDCLIPAAGLSSRMGKWKLTLPYKESTIVECTASNALSVCSRVILVTGHRGQELKDLFKNEKRVIPVENTSFKSGMFSSIQAGVPFIETEWFFISMGDMPEITSELYTFLIEAQRNSPHMEILRPLYKGKRGHPVLLKKSVISTILSEPYTSEMKNVFSHHTVLDLPLDLPESFLDIDTEEEYRKLLG